EDVVLGELAVDLAGQDGLPHLAHDCALLVRVGVLHVLLGDGGPALHHRRAAQVGQQRTGATPEVDAAVAVEVAVLGSHHRVLQDLGDVLLVHRNVLLELPEDADLVAALVEHVADPRGEQGLGSGDGGGQGREEERGQDGPGHGEGDGGGRHHEQGDGAQHRAHAGHPPTSSGISTFTRPSSSTATG